MRPVALRVDQRGPERRVFPRGCSSARQDEHLLAGVQVPLTACRSSSVASLWAKWAPSLTGDFARNVTPRPGSRCRSDGRGLLCVDLHGRFEHALEDVGEALGAVEEGVDRVGVVLGFGALVHRVQVGEDV